VTQARYMVSPARTAGIHVSILKNPFELLLCKAPERMTEVQVPINLDTVLMPVVGRIRQPLIIRVVREPASIPDQHRTDLTLLGDKDGENVVIKPLQDLIVKTGPDDIDQRLTEDDRRSVVTAYAAGGLAAVEEPSNGLGLRAAANHPAGRFLIRPGEAGPELSRIPAHVRPQPRLQVLEQRGDVYDLSLFHPVRRAEQVPVIL